MADSVMPLPAESLESPTQTDVLARLSAVCANRDAPNLSEALVALSSFMAEDLLRVEADIERVPQREEVIGHSASHLLALKGKRLRPMCVALASKVGRGFGPSAQALAAAVELVHSATLLHDDVVDVGSMRRGQPTARVLYGNAASVFAGDWLLIEALRRVRRSGVPRVLDDLLDTIDEMIQAEAVQLENRGRLVVDFETYFAIIEGKTASLFRWGLRSGARAGHLDDAHAEALATYGQNLGVAFQIVDDALDFMGEAEETGKSLFTDLREGKVTYPVLVGMERDPSLRSMLADAVASESVSPAHARKVLATLRKSGAIDTSMSVARDYSVAAARAIEPLPAGAGQNSASFWWPKRPPDGGPKEAIVIVTVDSNADVRTVRDDLVRLGLWVERFESDGRTQFLVGAHSMVVPSDEVRAISGVASVFDAPSPHPKVDAMPRVVQCGPHKIGVGVEPAIMAGPCSVESDGSRPSHGGRPRRARRALFARGRVQATDLSV